MSITDVIKKGTMLGLGLATLTKEKAEEFAGEMIKKGEVSKAEGGKIVKDLMDKARDAEKNLTSKISDEISKTLAKAGLVSKKEFDSLAKQVTSLEKKIHKAN